MNPDDSPGRRRDASRAVARRLAADSIASGNDTGWFETLYAAAEQGTATVPWADLAPNQGLVSALAGVRGGGRAIVTGCGLGDDAEHVASLGFATVAFDVSPTAVDTARRRFPCSTVEYVNADLLSIPAAVSISTPAGIWLAAWATKPARWTPCPTGPWNPSPGWQTRSRCGG